MLEVHLHKQPFNDYFHCMLSSKKKFRYWNSFAAKRYVKWNNKTSEVNFLIWMSLLKSNWTFLHSSLIIRVVYFHLNVNFKLVNKKVVFSFVWLFPGCFFGGKLIIKANKNISGCLKTCLLLRKSENKKII